MTAPARPHKPEYVLYIHGLGPVTVCACHWMQPVWRARKRGSRHQPAAT
jgi:hypothetical protein